MKNYASFYVYVKLLYSLKVSVVHFQVLKWIY